MAKANDKPEKERRTRGDGSVQTIIPGKKYKAALSITVNGKRTRKTFTADKEHKVIAMLNKFKAEQANGTLVVSPKTTFGDYAKRWLEMKKSEIAPTTWDSYASALKVDVLGAIGGIQLDKLTTVHVNDYITECFDKDLASATVSRRAIMIHGVLETAVNEGLIGRNVARKSRSVKRTQEEVEIYTEEETKKLLEVAKKGLELKGRFYRPLYYIVLFALATGARRGEIIALRWENVDTENNTVTIKESVAPVTGGVYVGTPKTKTSLRTISVDPRVIAELLKTKTESPYVFHTIQGKRFHSAQVSKWYRELLKDCGLQGRHFHALRHTHATRLIKAKHNIKAVSERLGHSSVSTTLSLYVHNDFAQDKALAEDSGSWLFDE